MPEQMPASARNHHPGAATHGGPALAELAVEKLSPIAAEMRRLLAAPDYIDRVLVDGADRARAIADKTIAGVKDIVGFIRKK